MGGVLEDDHGAGFLLPLNESGLALSGFIRQVQGGGLEARASSSHLVALALGPGGGRRRAEGRRGAGV